MYKSATHNGLTCLFDDKKHIYTIKETGKRLTSVTSIIRNYTPAFDAFAMSEKMVETKNKKYIGMDSEQIRQQWTEKGQLAAEEGTLLHSYLEKWPVTGGYGFNPVTPRVLAMCKQVDRLYVKLLERFDFIESEKLIFSKKLGIAGQVDLLMFDKATNEIIVLDLKSNSKTLTDEETSFQKMLSPIEHLGSCNINSYGLQLELYCEILKEENYYPDAVGFRKALLHVMPSITKVVKVSDYPGEVKKLLTP